MFLSRTFRFLLILALLVFPAAGQAEEKAQSQTAGSPVKLSCFSIVPTESKPGVDYYNYASCDTLCAEKGAVCTGMQNGGMNPPVTCSDPATRFRGVCRCCAVKP